MRFLAGILWCGKGEVMIRVIYSLVNYLIIYYIIIIYFIIIFCFSGWGFGCRGVFIFWFVGVGGGLLG